MQQFFKTILPSYDIRAASLHIEKELHTKSWHHDLHYKIRADGVAYSARLIRKNRSPHEAFGILNEKIIEEQIRFITFLNEQNIPFMKMKLTADQKPYIYVSFKNKVYLFVLFQWMDGKHITCCDEKVAKIFGQKAREILEVSSRFHSPVFKKTSHLNGYTQFIELIREKTTSLSEPLNQRIETYLEKAECFIKHSYPPNGYEFIVQSDLNPLNILWDEENLVAGIVDFESIGYTDRIEGLAWLIKWYSRTEGIHSHEMSPAVAKAFLQGYRYDHHLKFEEMTRLSSLLWLTGCLNWNFVKKTIELLEKGQSSPLDEHLKVYERRGEQLRGLLSNLRLSQDV